MVHSNNILTKDAAWYFAGRHSMAQNPPLRADRTMISVFPQVSSVMKELSCQTSLVRYHACPIEMPMSILYNPECEAMVDKR